MILCCVLWSVARHTMSNACVRVQRHSELCIGQEIRLYLHCVMQCDDIVLRKWTAGNDTMSDACMRV